VGPRHRAVRDAGQPGATPPLGRAKGTFGSATLPPHSLLKNDVGIAIIKREPYWMGSQALSS
jgi:hypothetical protein